MTNLTSFIAELEELEKKATPGDWPNYRDSELMEQCWLHYDLLQTRDDRAPYAIMPSDADLICASRSALPKLLACVKVLSEACVDVSTITNTDFMYNDSQLLRMRITYASQALAKCESIIAGEK